MSDTEDYNIDRIIEDFLAGLSLPLGWTIVVGDFTATATKYRVFARQTQALKLDHLTTVYGELEADDQSIGYGDQMVWMVCKDQQGGEYEVRLTPSADRAALYVNSLFAARLIDIKQNANLLGELVYCIED